MDSRAHHGSARVGDARRDTSRYFDRLTEYRAGRADEFVEYLASAAVHASEAAEESARALSELPARWKHLATPRMNSADEAIVFRLLDTPILNADMAQHITGTTDASTYRTLGRLTDAGVLELISTSKRNQIWAATDVLAELGALSDAIGRRTKSHLGPPHVIPTWHQHDPG